MGVDQRIMSLRKMSQEGLRIFDSGNTKKGYSIVEEAVNLAPEDPYVLNNQALLLVRLKSPLPALWIFFVVFKKIENDDEPQDLKAVLKNIGDCLAVIKKTGLDSDQALSDMHIFWAIFDSLKENPTCVERSILAGKLLYDCIVLAHQDGLAHLRDGRPERARDIFCQILEFSVLENIALRQNYISALEALRQDSLAFANAKNLAIDLVARQGMDRFGIDNLASAVKVFHPNYSDFAYASAKAMLTEWLSSQKMKDGGIKTLKKVIAVLSDQLSF